MAASKDEPVSQPTISLVVIGLMLLLGLGLTSLVAFAQIRKQAVA